MACPSETGDDTKNQGAESKQIKIVVSASGIPDFASKLMRRQKRNVENPNRMRGYEISPEFDMYQHQQRQHQQQPHQHNQYQHPHQQKYQQQIQPQSQQEPQVHKFDLNPNKNTGSSAHYIESMGEENSQPDGRDSFEPIQNTPRQMSPPQVIGEEKRGRVEEEESSGPKYEFNYDIPKDSFQSDVINGQFSTFAKLPMSFESLIQSDASFLDSLSESPPDNVDRSVTSNYNNIPSTNHNNIPSTNQYQPSMSPVREQAKNEPVVSNLRTNTDDSDYDQEVYEPIQPRQPVIQQSNQRSPLSNQYTQPDQYDSQTNQHSQPNQYTHQNQQYFPPESQSHHQPQQKMIPLSPSPKPSRQIDLPVFVGGMNEMREPESHEYVNLRTNSNPRLLPQLPPPHQMQIIPIRRAPVPFKGLIRQASQVLRQPYQGFMERSSNSDSPNSDSSNSVSSLDKYLSSQNALIRYRKPKPPRLLLPQRNREVNKMIQQSYPNNFASEQRVKDMMMMYYTTTPPPPPPQKVVNAQLQVIKNGIPTMPALPKQLSINYVSGPPPPPPPKDPYGMMSHTTPPPPPPPTHQRRRPSTYDRVMDQMWDKYTTTPPPPPPPSKIIQFGLNFR